MTSGDTENEKVFGGFKNRRRAKRFLKETLEPRHKALDAVHKINEEEYNRKREERKMGDPEVEPPCPVTLVGDHTDDHDSDGVRMYLVLPVISPTLFEPEKDGEKKSKDAQESENPEKARSKPKPEKARGKPKSEKARSESKPEKANKSKVLKKDSVEPVRRSTRKRKITS